MTPHKDVISIICFIIPNKIQSTRGYNLRMPAPVYFSIVADVPLLRILRGSGMNDMNVRDGWDITFSHSEVYFTILLPRDPATHSISATTSGLIRGIF